MKSIIWFDEKNIKKEAVGGKAWNLIQLSRAGFRVPNFFVITTGVFNSTSIHLDAEIIENFDTLNSPHVAVRSSATCEDQTHSSFAGQFESYLSLRREQLVAAVKDCWGNVRSQRVIHYAKSHNIDPNLIKMAVIVQEMISAEKGGVIFTEDVFENKKNELLIESAAGLGEQIVSGIADPERIIVSKTHSRILERESPEGEILSGKETSDLTRIALKIEKFYKSPQDIEWAIQNKKIYILQSRPITH